MAASLPDSSEGPQRTYFCSAVWLPWKQASVGYIYKSHEEDVQGGDRVVKVFSQQGGAVHRSYPWKAGGCRPQGHPRPPGATEIACSFCFYLRFPENNAVRLNKKQQRESCQNETSQCQMLRHLKKLIREQSLYFRCAACDGEMNRRLLEVMGHLVRSPVFLFLGTSSFSLLISSLKFRHRSRAKTLKENKMIFCFFFRTVICLILLIFTLLQILKHTGKQTSSWICSPFCRLQLVLRAIPHASASLYVSAFSKYELIL